MAPASRGVTATGGQGPCVVAAVQYRASAGKGDNIRALSVLVAEAAARGAGIIVLPEMCTTGLSVGSREAAREVAETIPGPSSDAFAALARQHGTYLVLGLAEYDPGSGACYNAQIVLDPAGHVVGHYRKTHLYGADLEWAAPGDLGYLAVDTVWGRIGLGVCCDINYWELMGFLREARVNLFAYSTNWVGDEAPLPYWAAMVAGGGYHLVAANNWGTDGELRFSGGSAVLAPDGTVLAQSPPAGDTVICAVVGPFLAGPADAPPPGDGQATSR